MSKIHYVLITLIVCVLGYFAYQKISQTPSTATPQTMATPAAQPEGLTSEGLPLDPMAGETPAPYVPSPEEAADAGPSSMPAIDSSLSAEEAAAFENPTQMNEMMKKTMEQIIDSQVSMVYGNLFKELHLDPAKETALRSNLGQRMQAEQEISMKIFDPNLTTEAILEYQAKQKTALEQDLEKSGLTSEAKASVTEYTENMQVHQAAGVIGDILKKSGVEEHQRDGFLDNYKAWLASQPKETPSFGGFTADSIQDLRERFKGTTLGSKEFTLKTTQIMEEGLKKQMKFMKSQQLPEAAITAIKAQLEAPIQMMKQAASATQPNDVIQP